jgi:hypothetical protein
VHGRWHGRTSEVSLQEKPHSIERMSVLEEVKRVLRDFGFEVQETSYGAVRRAGAMCPPRRMVNEKICAYGLPSWFVGLNMLRLN